MNDDSRASWHTRESRPQASPMRLGLVGVESSHTDQIVDLVARGLLGDGVTVAALCAPRSQWAAQVPVGRLRRLARASARPGRGRRGGRATPEIFVGSAEETATWLRDRADLVVVGDRDARAHAAHAEPILRAGIPVFVDKPFVVDSGQAEKLLATAENAGVLLTSWSPLRWHSSVQELASSVRASQGGVVVSASGPGDQGSPYAGLSFYGVHAVEMALALLRGPVQDVRRMDGEGVVVLCVRTPRDVATISLAAPTEREQTPFHLCVVGADFREGRSIELSADYLLPGLRAACAAVRTGVSPVGSQELVDVVRVLETLR